MIDFSKITGITLPPPPGDVATVTITIKNYNCGTITYNGVQHTTTFTANIGDTIEIQGVDVAINNPNATPSRTPYQMLNERTSYTVVSDATFEGKSQFSGNTSTGMYYLLSITDTPFTGVVTQIADASGRVIWSAKPSTVTLTIDTVFGYINIGYSDFISTTCYYTMPTGENGNLTSEGSYEFPIGTTICISMEYGYNKTGMAVYLNDEQVAYSDNYLSYEHALTTNTVVSGMIDYMGGRYYITET